MADLMNFSRLVKVDSIVVNLQGGIGEPRNASRRATASHEAPWSTVEGTEDRTGDPKAGL